MTTTIDIPPELLNEAMRHANAADEREAAVRALEEFNRRHRQAELIGHLGTFRDFLSPEELAGSRAARSDRYRPD